MRTRLTRFAAVALAAIAMAPLCSIAQEHDHAEPIQSSDGVGEAIQLTINPEARVSVVWRGSMPLTSTCGQALSLPVRVVNQGFVTAPIEAALVGTSTSDDITLDFPMEPLNGMREERRTLRVTLNSPGLFDLTIAFHARGDVSDLGGRDRIHLLLRCAR
jgi:hypothetical protein